MSAVVLRNEIVHYEVLGRGRPLILLHDWVGSWRYWIPSMQATSVGFRTYALDLWGFGDTAKNPAYYDLEQQAGLLDDFIDSLGIGKVALIGHGLGALAGILFARRRPEVVDRLMAISLPAQETAVHARLRYSAPGELADWLLGHSPAAQAAAAEAAKADRKAILLSLTALENLDLPRLPHQLETPLLLVHGQNDPAIAFPDEAHVAGLPEHAHFVSLEAASHFPMLDEPSRFNRLLNDFLNLLSGESPRQLQLKDEWKRRVR